MAVTISDTTVEPSEKAWITHRLGRDADRSPLELQLGVVNGTEDGPTLWIQGCLHGNEPVGGMAIRDVLCDIDPESLAGTLIGLPVANPTAFANKQRETQIRHIGMGDVNALFPGDPAGPFPERLADAIFRLIGEHADMAVDIHSADEQTVMHTEFAYVPDTGGEVTDRARGLATAAGVSHLVELPPGEIEGFLIASLAEVDIPGIMLESGGGSQVYDFAYELYVNGIRNIARSLGMVGGEPPANEPVRHQELTFLFADTGGFVEMDVRGGDRVSAGDELGRITGLRGEVVETVTAPASSDILAVRSYPTARPGDLMVELAPRSDT